MNLIWGPSFHHLLGYFIYSCTHLIKSIIFQIVIVNNHQNQFRGLDALSLVELLDDIY